MPVTGNKPTTYTLSIRILADGFSFFVTEPSSGDLMHREDLTVKEVVDKQKALRDMLLSQPLQRYKYNKVRAIAETPATFLPLEQLDDSQLDAYYNTVFHQTNDGQCMLCKRVVEDLSVVNLFSVEKVTYKILSETYPGTVFTSVQADVLEQTAQFCKKQDFSQAPLFAHFENSQLHIFSVFQGKLLFANTFPIDDESNALFFLLSVWKELKLNAEENYCFVSGSKAAAKSLADKLSQYILNVERLDITTLHS